MNTLTGTRRGISLRLKLIGPFIAGTLIIAGAVVYVTYTSQLRSVEEQARKQAESIIAQTLATRAVYTKDVVGKLTADGIAAFPSQDFAAVSGGIPLPATLVHRISDIVNQQGLYQINLISPWAINPAKAPTSGWETEAVAQLVSNPETDQSILETSGGESRLLYMSTDYASAETCVTCHNAHPDSPKRDFKLNDMMGALVVDVPLTEPFAQARSQALITSLGFLAALASFVVIVLWLQERSVFRPVEQLMQASRKMAQGELSTIVEVKSADEIGTLATSFNQMTSQLRETLASLEQRVTDRTKELAIVAEVSTATSNILQVDQLLQAVVDLTKERFNLYHSHIYLLDESGINLVLASGAGEPGRQMVAEGRSIPLEREQSLVARAARERKGVTVNDVTQAADFLPNPLLPDTRSELAVPMIAGGKVIGVFDIQSDVVGRFTDADVNIQTTLASQVAASIQNVRSFEQAKSQADYESLVNTIGQKIQRATSVEDTLQTAVREIGLALGASRVSANIGAGQQANGNASNRN